MSITGSKAKITCIEKQRKKRLTSTLEALQQVNKIPPLSQRLKVAGIKESKSEEKKASKIKCSKKRKNYYKKLYLEKPAPGSFKNGTKPKRKVRKLTKDYLLPYLTESRHVVQNVERFPKNPVQPSEKAEDNVQANAKETVFVSLDFIQDCQNYKRNVRTCKFVKLKRFQKKKKTAVKRSQHKSHKKKSPKKEKSQAIKSVPNIPVGQEQLNENSDEENFYPKSSEENTAVTGNDTTKFEKNEDKPPVNPEVKYPFESESLNKASDEDITSDSTDNVAKIDKKFLESLLSIAMGMEKGDETKEEKETKKAGVSEKQKKAKAGKVYLEGKIPVEPESNSLKNEKEVTPTAAVVENESKPMLSYKELISTKLTRDIAKSEARIQPLKGAGGEGSKMKSEKNMSLSKPENDDNRKKRKNRNKIMKNSSEEFVEASFPSEVSKVADVKELWRRDDREKSENSLSSYSSCTVPEGEEIPEWKNLGLQSYKILKKLVEEEVTKITQKSVKKDNTVEADKEIISKAESSKESGKLKSNFNKSKAPLIETIQITKKEQDMKGNDLPIVQKLPLHIKKRQHYSVYEGKKQKSQISNSISQDTPKESKEEFQFLDEMKKNVNPKAIIQNWSILNRLEQAFLVLGTPTFSTKKHPNDLDDKNSNNNKKRTTGAVKLPEGFYQKIKKTRSKEVLVKKKPKEPLSAVGSSTPKSQEDSFPKSAVQTIQTKKTKIDIKPNVLKEKPGNKSEKDFKHDNPTIITVLKDEEIKLKQKEKKTSRQTSDGLSPKKTVIYSTEKMKSSGESRHSKRESKGLKSECGTPPEQTKAQEAKLKFSKMATKVLKVNQNQEKHPDGNLERKKTFNIIQMRDTTVIQPRKSKSCNKIDANCDLDGVKFCYSQTKAHENINNKVELGRRMESEATKRTFKKTVKTYSIKEKPLQTNVKPKSVGEKDLSRGNREGSMKTPKSRGNAEKNFEKSCPAEELPQQMLEKKELNNTLKKRAIKERSILSMRVNQSDAEEQRNKLPNIQEKLETGKIGHPASNSVASYKKDIRIDSDTLQQKLLRNYSNISCVSTSTYDLAEPNMQNKRTETHLRLIIREFQDDDSLEDPELVLSSSSLSSHVFGKRQSLMVGIEQTEINPSKKQQLWEKDINYYHALVREIMSHYKRIDGFLKQSEHYDSFSSSFVNLLSKNSETGEELSVISDDLQSLQEYRKKVMYEYQALPFCEYKSKLEQKKKEDTKSEDARKRNLQVVKDVKTGMDLDVKDFRLNIQKVMDSQLFVDADLLVKRKEPTLKFKDKNSSLQDVLLCKKRLTKTNSNEIPHHIHSCRYPFPRLSAVSKLLGADVREIN